MNVKELKHSLKGCEEFYVAFNDLDLDLFNHHKTTGIKVKDFLCKEDSYEFPYECYEIFYDYGWSGYGDTDYNIVMFYEKGPGILHSNWTKAALYNESYLDELIPEEKERYLDYLKLFEKKLDKISINNKKELEKINAVKRRNKK